MTGGLSENAREEFWMHCRNCEGWANHPVFSLDVDLKHLVPVVLHIDGAEMYRATEYHVVSWSSMLSSLTVADVYDKKFLSVALPHELISRTKQDGFSKKK